jgi:hypothetical protein
MTSCHITEESYLHSCHCENLKMLGFRNVDRSKWCGQVVKSQCRIEPATFNCCYPYTERISYYLSLCCVSGKGSKNIADSTKSGGTSVLTSRKSSSTPSLPDATENHSKTSVASTEQAASADNLAAKVQVTRCGLCQQDCCSSQSMLLCGAFP